MFVDQLLYSVCCPTMSDAFSSSSETALQRLVDVTARISTPLEKLQEIYQIKETCDFISQRKFEKVITLFIILLNVFLMLMSKF